MVGIRYSLSNDDRANRELPHKTVILMWIQSNIEHKKRFPTWTLVCLLCMTLMALPQSLTLSRWLMAWMACCGSAIWIRAVSFLLNRIFTRCTKDHLKPMKITLRYGTCSMKAKENRGSHLDSPKKPGYGFGSKNTYPQHCLPPSSREIINIIWMFICVTADGLC